MSMINCPECGKEVSDGAATCPNCGHQLKVQKSKKGRGCLIAIIVVVVLIAIVAIFGSGSSKPKKVDGGSSDTEASTTEEQTDAKEEEQTVFGVGEAVDLDGIQTTLVSVEESAGSEYNKPADGNVFLICTFEINNNSDKEINVSSMMSMEAYADGYAVNSSLTASMETDVPTLDGTIAAGKNMNGVIGYEVAADWQELEINFTPDYWGGTAITFKANK